MPELKICPACKEEINKKATKCPKCQEDLRNWFNKHPIITIFLVLMLIWAIANDWLQNTSTTTNQQNASITTNQENTPVVKENWQYSEKTNEMDWIKTYFATTKSINLIDLSFPYWTTWAQLMLRKTWNNPMDVMFSVDKWQILDYNKKARIKFDDQQPISVDITWTSDWSSNVVFLWSVNTLITKLKISKTVMVELEYFQDWNKLAKFNVEWLKLD